MSSFSECRIAIPVVAKSLIRLLAIPEIGAVDAVAFRYEAGCRHFTDQAFCTWFAF